MAKITLDLNQFKASGVYTVEFDESERIVISSETLRLVVGFSRKGPFNAPVFLRDLKTARKTFGNIDTFLEKRGSFFHRTIETCLQTGPVFAINLLPLNNAPISEGGDAVEYRSFSLDVNEENGNISKDLLSSFYNKERFWFADTENFNAIANNNALNKNRLLHVTNLGQTPLSVLIRKPNPAVQGYAVTAREWYGTGNVPEFIREFDYMEDYFLELIIVEGDWTDYASLSEDPIYSKYFDKRGIKVDKLNEFLALDETTTVANFVGSIIPDFVDGNGSNQFLEVLVNNATSMTGVFISINRDALDDYANSEFKIDTIGHNLINSSSDTINFLSYNTPISKGIEFKDFDDSFDETTFSLANYTRAYVSSSPIGGASGLFGNVLVIPKPAQSETTFNIRKYQELIDGLSDISLIKTHGTQEGYDYVKVDQVVDNGQEARIVLSNPNMSSYYNTITADFKEIVNGEIILNSDATITNEGIAYISAPGFKRYFVVKNDANDDSILSIVSPTSGTTGIHSPDKYVSGASALAELESALLAGTFYPEDVSITIWDNYTTNVDFVVDTTGDLLTVVFSPDKVLHTDDYLEAYPGSKLSKDIKNSRIVDGDIIYNAPNSWFYINVDEEWGNYLNSSSKILYGLQGTRIRQYENVGLTNQVVGNDFVDGVTVKSYDADGNIFGANKDLIIYSSSLENLRTEVPIIPNSINASRTTFRVTEANSKLIEDGYFLVNSGGTDLIRVVSKIKKVNQSTGEFEYEINTTIGVDATNDKVIAFTPINTYADRLQFTSLSGFKLTDYHLPKNQSQLEKIYGVIENTNLGITLASKDIISYRYIVDTMGFGIAPMMGPKSILTRLAKNRQKCMAIINAPSIKDFMNSTDPRFTDEPNPAEGNPRPTLNTSYIASGGNLSLGPSFKFSLPDEENGAKFFGAFTPWLTIRENNKNIVVPPAADVSNNFIRKFLSGQPYSIVAGPRRGIISNPKLVGLEYDYTLQDREYLEPFGLNPIVTVRNVGTMIYSSQSGYQRTLSAFNNLHVRDLLITIETGIEDILTQYLFEFNDASTRLEIKSIVENYLSNIRNAGGINDFVVIMDDLNNTSETIDQNFGIIDIAVEPPHGMNKFINRVTILKTGVIASGGFTIA